MLSRGKVARLLVLRVLWMICLALRYAESAVLDDLAPCPNGCDRGRYCDTFMRFCESCQYCDSTSPCWSSCSDWLTTTQRPTNVAASLSTGAKTALPQTDAPPKNPFSDAFISPLTTSHTSVADLHVALLFGVLIAGFIFSIIGYCYCFHWSALRKCLRRSSTLPQVEDTESTTAIATERGQLITVGCSSDNPGSRGVIIDVALPAAPNQDGVGPISVPGELDPTKPFNTQYSHQGEEMNIRENPLDALQDDVPLNTEMLQQSIPTTPRCAHHHTPRPALSQTVTDGTHDNHEVTTGASSFSASLSDEAGASRDAS